MAVKPSSFNLTAVTRAEQVLLWARQAAPAAFQEVPFTTDSAEYNVLQSPSASTKIDVGYLPEQDAPAKRPGAAAGANPLSAKGYTLDPLYAWGIGFYVMNFQSTTGNGPISR
jgi:peptide/nickel transport system substrate-binding protein